MSSSDFLRRLELVDLNTSDAEPPPREFEERHEFERIERGPVREISPEQAFKNGVAQGEQIGREAALKELVPVIDAFHSMAASMAAVRSQRLDELESDLVDVASEIARRILRGELQQQGDVVVRLARACLDEARGEGDGVLHVNPRELELVRIHVAELEAELADAAIRVEPDAAIEPGCVVLETPRRCYEGRPERMLDAAREQLQDASGEDAG